MGHKNIDRAVERDMRQKAETEPQPTDSGYDGECAVCGRPCMANIRGSHDFCENHDIEDLRDMEAAMRDERERAAEEHARRVQAFTRR